MANTDDVSTMAGATRLVEQALATWGRLDVIVNNAGILRDRMLVNLTEDDWDSVMAVHLKSTYLLSHLGTRHWREKVKAGEPVDARIINTTSASGIYGNVGQTNYGAAKAAIAAFTVISSMEVARYGVHRQRRVPDGAHPHDRGPRDGALDRGPGRSPRSPLGLPRRGVAGLAAGGRRDRPGVPRVRTPSGRRRGLGPRARPRRRSPSPRRSMP